MEATVENKKISDPEYACYGMLYDPYLYPCRVECDFRESCSEELKRRMKYMGQENFEQAQRELIVSSERTLEEIQRKYPGVNLSESKTFVFPPEEIKDPVKARVDLLPRVRQSVISVGFASVVKGGLTWFLYRDKPVLQTTRRVATSLDGLIRITFYDSIRDVPPDVQPYVTQEFMMRGERLIFNRSSFNDLGLFLGRYATAVRGDYDRRKW